MINRRDFLFQIAVATTGVALGFNGFQRRAQAFTTHGTLAAMRSYGFGELIPAATQNTGETFLALPKGFQYKVLGKVGSKMSDGNKTPAAHDGMACFQDGNELRLIRNHEVANGNDGPAAGRELELADLFSFIKHEHVNNIVWLSKVKIFST